MAASSGDTLFESAVTKILKSWTVLELAINHGFGGAHSQEKGDWMVYAVCQWFKENDGIEAYELEDFLADVLNTEFDTIAEDGSLIQISEMICKMYSLCASGQTIDVVERLKLLPSPQVQHCVSATVCQEENDEETGDVFCNGSSDVSGSHENGVPAAQTTRADNSHQEEEMDTGDVEADDGWTVVKKGKRR
ncbi:pre-rRNA-processing protein TSR2 homolog [Liolophura sinensis]|uniref:pre-rRNA-processing protein TSR2 homolog n=1 Tax=Liolophura sinensis TaxID=3198878 RepID=UPI0031589808